MCDGVQVLGMHELRIHARCCQRPKNRYTDLPRLPKH